MVAERRLRSLSIAIPSNLVAGIKHLRDKTAVIGQIGRSAAIYRIEYIHVYRDDPDEANLIRHILNYMDTPQYLRRHLIPRIPELRYVGILPPLRTPHHPIQRDIDKLDEGDYREGVVLSNEIENTLINIGVEKPLTIVGNPPSRGSRVTIKILKKKPLLGMIVGRSEPDNYWGYRVNIFKNIYQLLKNEVDLKLSTSKKGITFSLVKKELEDKWRRTKEILIAFGSPMRGLQEILGGPPEDFFDYNLNTIPNQGTETIRTEEAVTSTLAVLNIFE